MSLSRSVDSQWSEESGRTVNSGQGGQRDNRGSLNELLLIALPMMLSAGTQALMHFIDRVFLSWYDLDTVAASMPAGMLFWTGLSLFHGVASYVNTFVAQYEGARRFDRVAASVWQGIYFSLITGFLIMLSAGLATPLFALTGHDADIARLEADYFFWLCAGGIPAVMVTVLSAFFTGRGETTQVFLVNLSGLCVNAVLDYAFVFGWGPIPAGGITGAAIATSLANLWMMLVLLALMLRPQVLAKYQPWAVWKWDWSLMQRLCWYGGPNGLLIFVDVAGWTLFIIAMGWIGKAELTATNLAFNLNSLVFTPIIGLGIAVSTLVGNRIGEREPRIASQSAWWAYAVAFVYVAACGLVYVLLPDPLISVYSMGSKDQAALDEIRPLIVQLLWFVALYSFFDALAIVFGSAIRGAGDTLFSLMFTVVCVVLLLVSPVLFLYSIGQLSMMSLWVICSAYIAIMGLGNLARFLQGRWQHMTVMESLPDLAEDSEAGDHSHTGTERLTDELGPAAEIAAAP